MVQKFSDVSPGSAFALDAAAVSDCKSGCALNSRYVTVNRWQIDKNSLAAPYQPDKRGKICKARARF